MKRSARDDFESQRKEIYFMAWRLSARFGSAMASAEKEPLRSIMSAFFAGKTYSPGAVSAVKNMARNLATSQHMPTSI